MKRILLPTLMLILAISLNAQAVAAPETTDFMRSNGKIYVVMVVILIILSGFFGYLISVDRKLKKLEENSK